MKEYTKMTMDEICKIVDRGGDLKRDLDYAVREHLDSLELSNKARDIIALTDFNSMAETFGGLFTVQQVEAYISEEY